MTKQAEILPMETGKVAVYNPFRAQLAELKKSNTSLVFDYESKTGNKDARSYIHKMRKTKAAVEDARKKEKAESLEYGRKVDAEAKELISDLEAMIDVHQKPLDEIEEREKVRVARIQGMLKHISECANGFIGGQPQPFGLLLHELEKKVVIDESFGEFREEAEKAREAAINKVKADMAEAAKRREEKEELERLRKESAEREQRERDERIAREAAEKARMKAEATARAEREEADRLANEERLAAARMEAEAKAAAEKRELQLKLDAERSEREKLEAQAAQKKAQDDRVAAEAKAKADAHSSQRESRSGR